MKRYLFVNIPMLGAIYPSLGVAKELVRQGNQVDYINSTVCQNMIEAAGCRFIPYKRLADARYEFKTQFKLHRIAYETALELEGSYDAILFDSWFYLGQTLAKQKGIPSIRLSSMFAMNQNVVHDMIYSDPNWFYMRLKATRKLFTWFMSRGIKTQTDNYFDEICENVTDLNLIFTTKEFQFRNEEFDERFQYVGAILYDRSQDQIEIPYDKMQYPIVYVAMGSLAKDRKFIERCIHAFGNKKVDLIVSVGNNLNLNTFQNLPSNIYLYHYVPQLDVLKHASLFISHGGMNSINEAMAIGVPMLVYPMFVDHFLIASQVEKCNVGRKIDIRKIKDDEFARIALDVMQDEMILNAVQKQKENMDIAGGAKRCCELIEQYLKEK